MFIAEKTFGRILLWADATGVAVGAGHGGHIAQIHWMLELDAGQRGKVHGFLLLDEDGVAEVAVLRDDFAFRTDVVVVVAAKAAVEVEVADIVGMSAPVDLHFREKRQLVDVLDFIDGAMNLRLLGLAEVGVLGGIEIANGFGDALHRGTGRVVLAGERGDGLLLEEGQRDIEAVSGDGAIHGEFGGSVDVGGAVVAIDAIHAALAGFGDLVPGEFGVLCVILRDGALRVLDAHVSDDLAFLIGGDVGDFIGGVDVPVDALRLAGGGITAAGLDEEADLQRGVFFITVVVVKDLELGSEKLLGPVAGFAGFRGGAQVLDGSWNGPGKGIERGLENLASAG